jgi:hypothetical protein
MAIRAVMLSHIERGTAEGNQTTRPTSKKIKLKNIEIQP